MLYGITLILLSILAVPSLILSKKPNAQELLDKIAPYQGWIGLVFCLWGVWGLIFGNIFGLGLLGMGIYGIIWWVTLLACNLVEAILGFMLGYGMINKYLLSKNEEAKKKGEALLAKLAPIQGKLGIFGIIVGLWVIVANFVVFALIAASH